MKPKISNVAASIRAKLKNALQGEHGRFDALLLLYMQERLLYRLSRSKYRERFILKGGLLLFSHTLMHSRPTIDTDFLGHQITNDMGELKAVFKEMAKMDCEDGLHFFASSIQARKIKEDAEYEGIRIHLEVGLEQARKTLQIDIGFGDVIVPKPEEIDFPTILDQPAAKIMAYSKESIIAEKFEAMVKLSFLNSRMKDFYDVYNLSVSFDFSGLILQEAIQETFKRRKVSFQQKPAIFQKEFKENSDKAIQWVAFLNRIKDKKMTSQFPEVLSLIAHFLGPVHVAIENNEKQDSFWDHKKLRWAK